MGAHHKTQLLSALGLGILFLGTISHTVARQWTDIEGRAIEAEFVSSRDDEVTIRKAGREFTLPLSRLSAADRDWIAEQEPAAPAADESAVTGLIKNHPVTEFYREDPKDWADGRVAKKCSEDAKSKD